jgi:chemotaxis protein CheZ
VQQYIGFDVDSSEYMLPILKVREIITMPSITTLPQLPAYIRGVTNLRGTIIPVVNLKKLLKAETATGEGDTVIVIATGKITYGIIVDSINGVVNIDADKIERPEKFITTDVDQIEGVAKLDNRLIILLDTSTILPLNDLTLLEEAIVDVQEVGDGSNVEVVRQMETIGGTVTVKELRDAKEFIDEKHELDERKNAIFDKMLKLMDALANNNYDEVEHIVGEFSAESDNDLFNEVGKVTRKLHDSLDDFKSSIDSGLDKITRDDVPNAVDKLQFVMAKTEDAANRTMEIAERYFEESDDFSKHIVHISGDEESVAYLKSFKASLDNDMTQLITAQQYQDITGQTIKKVIDLVNSVEVELVRLIAKFGMPLNVDISEIVTSAAPEIDNAAEINTQGNEKISQSDVESMLNDFGF